MNFRQRSYLVEGKVSDLAMDAVMAIHNIFQEYVKYYGTGKDNIFAEDVAEKMGVSESVAKRALNQSIKKGLVKSSLVELGKKQRNKTIWKYKKKSFYLTSAGIKAAKGKK